MNEKDHVKFDYSKITDTIYLGTNTCCAVHFDKELLSKGIVADISVEGEKLDRPYGVNYFLWLPTVDHTAPTIDALALGAQTIQYLVSRNMPVYVHCMNGHGRGPTVVAAYLISTGMSVNSAVRFVADKRPEIHIEPVQIDALNEFAKRVK